MPEPSNKRLWGEALLVWFATATGKWAFVASAGSDRIIFDQWAAEAPIYEKYLQGTLQVRDLFTPINEHRIVGTHLLNLLLISLNKQWDPLLQVVVNAVFHGCFVSLIGAWASASLSAKERGCVYLALFLLTLPPLSFHNAVWGFQSQVYIVLLLAFAGLAAVQCQASVYHWTAGTLLCCAACLCMAPGGIAGAALVLCGGLFWIGSRRLSRTAVTSIVSGTCILAVFLATYPGADAENQYQARSFHQLFVAFFSAISWPVANPYVFAWVNAPVMFVLVQAVRGRLHPGSPEHRVVLLASWGAGVGLAFALSRGGAFQPFSHLPSRHMDFLVPLGIANLLGLVCFIRSRASANKALLVGGAAAWSLAVCWGILSIIVENVRDIQLRSKYRWLVENQVREYSLTLDPTLYKPAWGSREAINTTLKSEAIRAVRPPSLQQEVTLTWPISVGQPRVVPSLANLSLTNFTFWQFLTEGTPLAKPLTSAPFALTGPAIEFFVNCSATGGGADITFESTTTDAHFRVDTRNFSPDEWQKAAVRLPPDVYTLTIKNQVSDASIVLSEPRKLGIMGYFARRLLAERRSLVCSSVLAVFLLLAWTFGPSLNVRLSSAPSP